MLAVHEITLLNVWSVLSQNIINIIFNILIKKVK